jgi:hypothetical protein
VVSQVFSVCFENSLVCKDESAPWAGACQWISCRNQHRCEKMWHSIMCSGMYSGVLVPRAGSTPGPAFGSARQYRDGERPLAS